LRGDSTRAREQLGWKPRTNFETMIRDMVDADIKRLSV
jgi:GDP-D-mannose dehydratase